MCQNNVFYCCIRVIFKSETSEAIIHQDSKACCVRTYYMYRRTYENTLQTERCVHCQQVLQGCQLTE